MRKLTLELDALKVESFDTTPAGRGGGGTVRGHRWEEAGIDDGTVISGGDPNCGTVGADTCEGCGSGYRTCYTCNDRSCDGNGGCTIIATCLTCTLEVCCGCTRDDSRCDAVAVPVTPY